MAQAWISEHSSRVLSEGALRRCLTEQPVEVSVYARHGEGDGVQTLLSPALQTLQPGLIHFFWGLRLLQTAPYVTAAGGKIIFEIYINTYTVKNKQTLVNI